MSDNLKNQLDEVHRNIRLTKRQIKKAKRGGYQTLPGMDYSFESPCWATLVLEDQLRDLQIQEADIKRQMEEEKCSEKN